MFDNVKLPRWLRWSAFGVAGLYFLAKVGLAVAWLLKVQGTDRFEPAIGLLDIGLGILMVIAGAGLSQTGEFTRMARILDKRIRNHVTEEHDKTRHENSIEHEKTRQLVRERSLQLDEARKIYHVPLRIREDLIGRENILNDVKNSLQKNRDVVLYGLPGVGKTAITLYLVADKDILAEYDVLWAGLGQSPAIHNILQEWAKAVKIRSERIFELIDSESIRNEIEDRIKLRRVMIIVDDVWDIEHTTSLRINGPQVTYLYTTRMPGIAEQLIEDDQHIIRVPELSFEEGMVLLNRLAPSVVDRAPDRCRELINILDGLPLAIKIMGNHLREEVSSGLSFLDKALIQLSDPKKRIDTASTVSSYLYVFKPNRTHETGE